MNIAVVLKQVPDTEAVLKADPSIDGSIVEDNIKFILNPYDEYAVEEAVTIAEATGGEVIGVCIGPERSETAIRTALAMGVKRAVLVSDSDAVDTDIVTQGKIIATVIKDLDVSLVLCGRAMIDTQEDAMAAIVGQALEMPHVLEANKIDINGDKVAVVREIDGGAIEVDVSIPAVISCQKGLNDPRYPTLMAIKRCKKKELKKLTLADLAIQRQPPKSKIVALQTPPPRAEGKKVEGETVDVVAQTIKWLAEDAKVI